jgi:hypothetical protein
MSAPMSTSPSPAESGAPTGSGPAASEPPAPRWLRLAGLGVACLGALVVAVVSAFLTPFRIGSILVPVSLLVVIGGLTVVTRYAYAVTGKAGLSFIPGALWLILSLVFSAPTTEGDIILSSRHWVAVVYTLIGSITLGVLAFRMIVPRR